MRFILVGTLLLTSALYASQLSITEIQSAIDNQNAQWRAEANKFTIMTAEERQRYVGALPVNPDDVAPHQILEIPLVENLPDSFDWRDNNGNWVTPVKDQGACGSCWAFSALGIVESWWRIRNNNPDLKIDLSEQYLLSCSDAGTCEEGGWMSNALEHIKQNSIALEADLPYQASSFIPCDNLKAGWEERALHIPDWGYVTLDEAHVDNIKSAVYRYPLSVSYEVFDDFYSYAGGVYEHTFGESSGWHAVVIVGWNDREQSWIVKNSWGPSWGDHGYFRIKWGDSSMGRYSPYIWNESPTAFFTSSVKSLNADLIYGDADTLQLSITNAGPDPAYFFANETNYDRDEANWLRLANSAGYLNVGESATIDLYINTRELDPGTFEHDIHVITNNSDNPGITVPIRLSVSRPQFDAQITDIALPERGCALLSWSTVSGSLKNVGLDAMTDFDLVCQVIQNEKILLSDTVHVDELAIRSEMDVTFAAFKLRETGYLECSISIINSKNDYNDFNNSLETVEPVTHLVEGFEQPSHAWITESGWSFSSLLNGHSGSGSAHVNAGVFPYLNDMNTTMTYTPGFELDGVDTLFVTFWTRYVTADSNDICSVEISGDSLNWDRVDSFTGVQPSWEQHIIDFTPFAHEQRTKAWIRFNYVSDAAGTSIGVLIDDLEVYTETLKTTVSNPPTHIAFEAQQPHKFYLEQNYPNPFNPSTTISYALAQPAQVRLTIYDIQGRLVDSIVDAHQSRGSHSINWNAFDKAAGIYFYTLAATTDSGERIIERKKMALIK
jgi:C1A family cysteine protease